MESGMLGNSHFSIEYLFRLVEIQKKLLVLALFTEVHLIQNIKMV